MGRLGFELLTGPACPGCDSTLWWVDVIAGALRRLDEGAVIELTHEAFCMGCAAPAPIR